MKLVGLMPVRNEDWVLGLSARVALQWCDRLVVLLHECEDRSPELAYDLSAEYPDRLIVTHMGGEWKEMEHRQWMLELARKASATHIAMIDADEVLTANLTEEPLYGVKPIRSLVETLAPGQMLELPGYNLRGSLDRYHSNGIWGNRWFSVAFKDTPEAYWAGDKFHSRNPAAVKWQNWRPIKQGEGGILHLWGASERRLRAKHALYKVVERTRFETKTVAAIDDLYNLAIKPRETWSFEVTPLEWWKHQVPRDCIAPHAEPWQEAEVRRLVAEHGKEKFQGLDLFGVA